MNSGVLVAAGRGTRMGSGTDKLFVEIGSLPVLAHSWRRLESCSSLDEVVVVVRPETRASVEQLAATLGVSKPWRTVIGGPERQDSVWNGLSAVDRNCELVAIHDAARPCTPPELFDRCLEAARRVGASVAAQRAIDTIKESDGGSRIARHLDRSKLWAVQTPQCFRFEIIRRALEWVRARGLSVTDDTAACELIGQPVELIESTTPNPKVTTASDVAWVELLLNQPSEARFPGAEPSLRARSAC
jgi:2-C-methyl-D-erythritol 4-phosphate cytidylyltransferase